MQSVPTQLSELPSYITYVLFNPAFNPKMALLLYAVLGVLLLIILVVGIMLLMGSNKGAQASRGRDLVDSEEFDRFAVGEVVEGREHDESATRIQAGLPPAKIPSPDAKRRARLAIAAVVVLMLIAVWTTAGYTTSDPALCKNCHWPASSHAKALAGTDRHAKVSCISCHESGGVIGRYLTGVPSRLIHFVNSGLPVVEEQEYGRVTLAACSSCHESALEGVAINVTRGLKVSHKEPLAASATCIDCHGLRAGVVGSHDAGMGPCLRCHDAKHASTQCSTCHDDRAAAAARARSASFTRVQIPDVSCGGCHDEKRECDSCHGTRMPHSAEFKAYAHARAGAVDFWYNGGKACSHCHTASRRPCQGCHGQLLGKAHGAGARWLAGGHQSASVQACDTCHRRYAYMATRNFCGDLCHTPVAIAESPR